MSICPLQELGVHQITKLGGSRLKRKSTPVALMGKRLTHMTSRLSEPSAKLVGTFSKPLRRLKHVLQMSKQLKQIQQLVGRDQLFGGFLCWFHVSFPGSTTAQGCPPCRFTFTGQRFGCSKNHLRPRHVASENSPYRFVGAITRVLTFGVEYLQLGGSSTTK